MRYSRKTPWLALALLATTMLTPPGVAQAAPGDALGPKFQVNTYTTHRQLFAAVAMDADGDFVVAWQSYGQDGSYEGVYAQRYDAAGVARGDEFRVNSYTMGYQLGPAVAMDADGDFVVVWRSNGQDGEFGGVYAQRFNAAGVPQGSEFQVNTYTTSGQMNPTVAMDADGDFVVAWGSWGQDGSYEGVFAQRYDAAGVPRGLEFQVNTFTEGFQVRPAVAMDADGDFVVAWVSYGRDVSVPGVFARRYDAAGTAQGPEFQVNSSTTGWQEIATVAMDADGDFVVAWTGSGPGDNYGIIARRCDAAGVPQGPEFQVNTYTTSGQMNPTVAMDADGDFVVAWGSWGQDGSDTGVFAQRFDAAGVPQGPEFQVDTYTNISQNSPAVAMDADGDFFVAWGSEGQDGSYWGVFAQRYQGAGPVPDDFTVDGRADILWRRASNGDTWLWQMDGFAVEDAGSIGRPDTVWQVRGLGDFNADTKSDVLWRNTTTGSAAIWLMDGFEGLGGAVIGGVDLDWKIVGVGDFDGDDHADILWHRTDGAVAIWLMDGLDFKAGRLIDTIPVFWEIEGAGDFDADAKSDILWRNTDSGAVAIWLMDGFDLAAGAVIGGVELDWQIEGPADFDGDAKWDILWHRADGATAIWKIDGLVVEDARIVGTPGPVWRVDGLGDTDGDRKSDIVWRHTDSGNTVVWQMNGFVIEDAQSIGDPPLEWHVQ